MKKVRVLGGGWYGAHITRNLLNCGYDVQLHERAACLFSGASGNMPGRLHLGFHYPRSKLTRAACQDHYSKFMAEYWHLTRAVPVNIYAIADKLSLVDFGNYVQSLKDEVEYVRIARPAEYGLEHVEGALLTGERHTVVRKARSYFTELLAHYIRFETEASAYSEDDFDLTVDCTFCAQESVGVDRYEPCVTGLLRGPTNFAITIMDGPFPSLYPWDEVDGLCSLTSAKHTPLTKECTNYSHARRILDEAEECVLKNQCEMMLDDLARFFPEVRTRYRLVGHMTAVRAMPLSGADARLVDVVMISPKTIRIRASKLDAIFYAEDVVMEALRCL